MGGTAGKYVAAREVAGANGELEGMEKRLLFGREGSGGYFCHWVA